MIVLLPETVDDKPLTLNLFKTLAENPKAGGHVTKVNIGNHIVTKYGDVANVTSRWVLFPKLLLKGTRGKTYAQQIQIVEKKGSDYEVACLFDAVVAIASRHVQLGERLFRKCYTRCQESINLGYRDWQLVVGGFDPGGLDVPISLSNLDYHNYGVVAGGLENLNFFYYNKSRRNSYPIDL